ncbi:hypothetical protein WG947_01905 [Pontibacter sp. H259]|uniref:hypothetical protein n=1 Tax=Pontibacter sp. H259 TaxID=3133421 RepID=UPI0030C277C1
MIEIIVAIILQITTIIGGGDADKSKEVPQDKAKTEKPVKGASEADAEGGSGTWEG